jgi:integrase
MGRRAAGSGTVYQDGNRWRGELDIGRDPRTGRRVKRKVSGKTKDECAAKLDELAAQAESTEVMPRLDTTVRDLVLDALANPPENVVSEITIEVHAGAAAKIIKAFGGTPAVKLTPRQVEAFLKAMAANGYATKTIGITRSLLIRALRRGQRDGLLTRNVAELVETPRGSRRKSRALTEAQVNTLLTSGLSTWWFAWVLVGAMTGLRPGELMALGWEDIDLDEGVFRVRYALHRAKDENGAGILVRAALKTERSKRTLQLDSPADRERVKAALTALKRDHAVNKLRYGPRYRESGVIFCTPHGLPYWRQPITAKFKILCSRAGIGEDWTARELRHTFCSQQSDAGVPLEDISAAMGHATVAITDTTYRHVFADKITVVRRRAR